MKRAFLKHIFEGKHKLFVSSMQQLLKNYNRMKSVFAAFVIAAFATTFFIFNQNTKSDDLTFANDVPILIPPPLNVIQSESAFCNTVITNKTNNIKQNMHV